MDPHRLVAAITSSSGDEFLVVRQLPPPPPPEAEEDEDEDEYRRYVDSDIYDLPWAPLRPLADSLPSEVAVDGAESIAGRLDLARFDVAAALDQVLMQAGLGSATPGKWKLLKYVEEAEFGPGPSINSLFIIGSLESKEETLQESSKWMSKECASKLLSEVKPCSTRLGPYVYIGLLHSTVSSNLKAVPALQCQEYPPGITLVPMKSKTLGPFHTTNLVVVLPNSVASGSKGSGFAACGDALLMDPGCCSKVHAELADLVASLPKKLVVLVTHHHYDHIDGLSVVQSCNPDAVLLAHGKTMNRIGKGNWSNGYNTVTGGEKICIGDQLLEVIAAPGHTDGHLGVLHVNTNALIVGDHCVGQGSARLDTEAGGNMKDYFHTTYKFLDLSPHVLIPMHGRMNLWPKQMLCGYLRHRRARESSILQSIENGAQTLFDIVAKTYGDVDRKLWLPASSNVRLHVDHLHYQQKLPKDFSMEKFEASCGISFTSQWAWAYVQTRISPAVLAAITLGGLAFAYALKKNSGT